MILRKQTHETTFQYENVQGDVGGNQTPTSFAQKKTSLRHRDECVTLMRTSMACGGSICTSCTTNSPFGSHATAAAQHRTNTTRLTSTRYLQQTTTPSFRVHCHQHKHRRRKKTITARIGNELGQNHIPRTSSSSSATIGTGIALGRNANEPYLCR
jgi:hypothetical protein